MSFRQYGGINYAARNNIVRNNYSNANNLSIMAKVGQPASYINFESDISGNTIYGPYIFQGDVDVIGNLNVSGTTTLNGDIISDLNVTGATTLNSTLNVTGATTLNGDVDIISDLNVTGATVLSSTLNVTGATTLNSALTMNSDINFTINTQSPNERQILFTGDTDTGYIKFNSVPGTDNSYLEIGTTDDYVPIYFTINASTVPAPNFGIMTLNTNGLTINYPKTSTPSSYALDVSGNMNVTGTTTLIGIPTAPTAAPLNNSTQIATTAYVDSAVTAGTTVVTQIYTSSQTIVLPSFKRLTITCVGGGGGGGLFNGSTTYGGSGGSGAAVFFEVINANSYSLAISIGTAGEKATIVGTSGGNGGSSSVIPPSGYLVTANGGLGGSPTTGGLGGVASGLYLYKLDGNNGSSLGSSNPQPISTPSNLNYGCGGGGGNTNLQAFNGTPGCVIVTYYY